MENIMIKYAVREIETTTNLIDIIYKCYVVIIMSTCCNCNTKHI